MASEDSEPSKKPSKGYGKRSVRQWVVIYILVAIVVYGLIYYFFMSGGSDGGATPDPSRGYGY